MGKVTIIVESDNVSTDKLYNSLRLLMTPEIVIKARIGAIEGKTPDIRVYIVPSDED